MTRIVLLSDTHGYLDDRLYPFFKSCDEIWHAGDLGSTFIFDEMQKFNVPVRAVYGNVDGNELKYSLAENLIWHVEEMTVLMTHIGGYPGKYPARIQKLLLQHTPRIFVCGHSHFLKVIYDKSFQLLHLNPGAAGREGFHQIRTALQFSISGDEVKDMQVLELGKRHS